MKGLKIKDSPPIGDLYVNSVSSRWSLDIAYAKNEVNDDWRVYD